MEAEQFYLNFQPVYNCARGKFDSCEALLRLKDENGSNVSPAEFIPLAEKRGLIVLTDSDGAGFLIRHKLSSCIPPNQLKHAYIPDVYGKERRKRQRGKEGKLGVEGMPPQVLEQVLRRAGATFLDEGARSEEAGPPLTKADLFAAGLSGGADSGARRLALLKRLELPEHMSANGLLAVLNGCYSRGEALELLNQKE